LHDYVIEAEDTADDDSDKVHGLGIEVGRSDTTGKARALLRSGGTATYEVKNETFLIRVSICL
jgi:hypothetical protein